MSIGSFALTGASPLFQKPLSCGQNRFPDRERYQKAFSGIFERQYYNNNGPLHEQLEVRLQTFLGVRHVICTSNSMLGLMVTLDALQLRGKVIVSAFVHPGTIQALLWAGLEPVWCDVDQCTHHLDMQQVVALIDEKVSAILAVNLWGGACDVSQLQQIADAHGIRLIFDSAHAFGCALPAGFIGGFGDAEIFSFHEDMILGAGDGGCIVTHDDELALRARSIRPSYGLEQTARIVRVANARLSEAQAAIALMNLDDFRAHQAHNRMLRAAYLRGFLSGIEGLTLHEPSRVTQSNWQHLIVSIDQLGYGLSRERLIEVLAAEKVYARRGFPQGVHLGTAVDLPNARHLYDSCLELPLGAQVTTIDIERLCDLLARIHCAASILRSRHDA
ncbi:DegT/DnrJ/EryC1/StrS family aminotransferase [Ferrovum myxofaciens]|jgi:dTDP-4-amino-4,6-dideoxygalactose transaminase|uniref:DegT/DnrJ/EryC1/StrS family aminotransferase n=1 Tax=Ferrovum myxofaciens TaxID=416213 RepID=UPI00068C06E2|nr:aminotransferase class I/II-fold pyridoxal phosphate-dependent enzyme [Ferrovum myxofaciens]